MASADTLCKKLLNVKNTVVESHDFYSDKDGVVHLRIKARPSAWHKDDCPFCSRRCPGYDRPVKNRKLWRGLDFGGILVEIEADYPSNPLPGAWCCNSDCSVGIPGKQLYQRL